MKGLLFPGQGAQFSGMGKELYDKSQEARNIFDGADNLLGFKLSEVMFSGSDEELKSTDITQPALFVHGVASFRSVENEISFKGVAGHSLGEFTALVASGCLSFEDALELVRTRANAMQKACELVPGTMAAVVGLDDKVVEDVCSNIQETVVTANYNCPGQLVISGSLEGVNKAVDELKEKGAKRAIVLEVGGAFHSPLMQPAKDELEEKINAITFNKPNCPIYQNVTARGETSPDEIKQNLIEQLTSPVKWTMSMEQMIADGFDEFIEMGGKGMVLRGLMRRINRSAQTDSVN
ncbi:MAG: ACP S-malonyltransferase [Saprospiraceae bacterium]|nr:ACP S-malonyltransferase [Saprospiraceae bacterium]